MIIIPLGDGEEATRPIVTANPGEALPMRVEPLERCTHGTDEQDCEDCSLLAYWRDEFGLLGMLSLEYGGPAVEAEAHRYRPDGFMHCRTSNAELDGAEAEDIAELVRRDLLTVNACWMCWPRTDAP